MYSEKTEESVVVHNYASSTLYPTNKPNKFVNKIQGIIHTPGQWEMAIDYIDYPHNWYNHPFSETLYIVTPRRDMAFLNTDNIPSSMITQLRDLLTNKLSPTYNDVPLVVPGSVKKKLFKQSFYVKQMIMKAGQYDTIQDYCTEFENSYKDAITEKIGGRIKLVINESTRKITIENKGHDIYLLSPGGYFLDILGFHSVIKFKPYFNGIQVKDSREAEGIPNITSITGIYVCSDLIEPAYVGDKTMNLLGIVPVKEYEGNRGMWQFDDLHYRKLRKADISEIDIELKTADGEPFPIEAGFVRVSLLFRQKRI